MAPPCAEAAFLPPTLPPACHLPRGQPQCAEAAARAPRIDECEDEEEFLDWDASPERMETETDDECMDD